MTFNADKGAFFKSVMGTLNHILVGDIVWLKRFATLISSRDALSYIGTIDKPESLDAMLFEGFSELKAVREKVDEVVITWVKQLSENDLDECVSYSSVAGNPHRKPFKGIST